MTKRITLLLIASVFLSVLTFAQDTPVPLGSSGDAAPLKKQYYFFSPRVSITVPHPMANRSFKKCFVGVYEISGGLNVYLYKGLFIGGMYKNGLMKITENKIADYNASLAYNNVSGKIGGDFYVGEMNKIIFSASAAYGHNWSEYQGLKHLDGEPAPKYTSYTTNFIEPEVNLYFLIESNFAIGATLGYTIQDAHFDPYDLSLNQYTQFNSHTAVSTKFLSFGFGFYYSMLRKKQAQS
ncbi:MAG: hypothetical protein ACJ77K_03410 [Bacteroidia bacterium]